MISGDFPPAVTGVGDYTRLLADALAQVGVAVEVFTGAAGGVAACPSDWGFGALGRILRAVDRLGPGCLVHIQYPALAYGRRPLINLLPGLLKLIRPECRVVLTTHEFRTVRRRWRLRVVPMLVAADAVILPDELDGPLIARWSRSAHGRIVGIPLGPHIVPAAGKGFDRVGWRAELGLPGTEPIVVFFGGVYKHKGVGELIAAVQNLRSRGMPARLLLLGAPDPDPAFAEHIRGLLVRSSDGPWARWLPNVAPEVVSSALQVADVAALPFHSGAMANRASLLTVLAHGVPTVTTRTAATPASFGPGTGMSMVPPQDPTALEARLDELLRSPETRQRLGQAGLVYAQQFSWPVIANRTLDLYRTVFPSPAYVPTPAARADVARR
jgi:polysaccharide biosynthesis protein PslF